MPEFDSDFGFDESFKPDNESLRDKIEECHRRMP
jgi:hypothetical protein